jgi:hypothetical protein
MVPLQSTEYEKILDALQPLSREEIAERFAQVVSPDDAKNFRVLVEGLSLDALRVVSARALFWLQRASPTSSAQRRDRQ